MINVTTIANGCNCYIVSDGETGILIDTGLNGKADQIIQEARKQNVKQIILTHGHMDHIQCAAKVATELQVPITMHENDLNLIADNLSQPMCGRTFKGHIVTFFSKLSAKGGSIQNFQVEDVVNTDKTIEVGGLQIELMELPGHTKGSMGVKIGDYFFVGDALMNMGKAGVSLIYENMDALYESARKIEKAGDVKIHYGHGRMTENRQWVKEN